MPEPPARSLGLDQQLADQSGMIGYPITPDDRQLLERVIYDLGSASRLGTILQLANGQTLAQVTAEILNLQDMARDIVDNYCAEPPKLASFLVAFCAEQPKIDELAALQALTTRVEQHVASAPFVVGVALRRLGEATDPRLRQLVAAAREDLIGVERHLLALEYCKAIHHRLHELQTQTYLELRRASQGKADRQLEPAELDNLKTQADTIAQFAAQARNKLAFLARIDPVFADQTWLANVEDALPLLRNPAGIEDVRGALQFLRAALRQRLPLFNSEIVETADAVPFRRAIELLRQAAQDPQAPADTLATVEDAATKLASLEQDLKAIVGLHDLWQQIDNQVWDLEGALPAPGRAASLTGMKLGWQGVSRLLERDRAVQSSPANDGLDGAVAQVNSVFAASPVDKEQLVAEMLPCISKIRLRFVGVDASLKDRCEQITSLRVPILAMVEADNGT